MKETLASEIIAEQQKEIIDLADVFKELLTVVSEDELLRLEKEWHKIQNPIGQSLLEMTIEERKRRKVDRV